MTPQSPPEPQTSFQEQAAPNSAETEVEELAEFLNLIDKLPMEHQGDFYRALGRLVDGYERRQRMLGHIQESLSQMRLDLKYLVFDLEATRRERDEYRQRLEFFAPE